MSEIQNESENDGDDMMQIFNIMHSSIDKLQERFANYYDEPTKEKYEEFDTLIVEFIALSRDLKNISKSLLPKSDRKKKDNTQPQPALETNPISTDNQIKVSSPTEPKKRGRKPKAN